SSEKLPLLVERADLLSRSDEEPHLSGERDDVGRAERGREGVRSDHKCWCDGGRVRPDRFQCQVDRHTLPPPPTHYQDFLFSVRVLWRRPRWRRPPTRPAKWAHHYSIPPTV